MRYHKDVYLSDKHKDDIIAITYQLNNKQWRYTLHCLDIIKDRFINLEQLLYFIKMELKLNSEDVFEIYTDEKDNIYKLCYRFLYNNVYDIILVISDDKQIITIYTNSKDDKHETLNKNLYIQI